MKRILPLLAAIVLLAAATGEGVKLTRRQQALHVLDRLSFGARPGDVDRIMQSGVGAWIDQQLHPERIPDRALDARLGKYPTLSMSSEQIIQRFYVPVVEARKEAKKNGDDKETLREMQQYIPYDQRPRRVVEELASQRT